MAGNTEPPVLLKALQHNCAQGGQTMEAIMKSAVKREADLVLIQEPWGEKVKDSTRSHPSFTFIKGEESAVPKCWIAVNRTSGCWITELKNLAKGCRNYVQVIEVVPPGGDAIIIANVYDQEDRTKKSRPAQDAAWGEIVKLRSMIISRDMNAHSKMWNPKATYSRNHTFGECLIEEEDLFVWNMEEATRKGPEAMNHFIIGLTLSSPNIELDWRLLDEEAAGSDHEVLLWGVLGTPPPRADTSAETTGWDISGWDPTGESEEEGKRKSEERRAKARECYLVGARRTPIL